MTVATRAALIALLALLACETMPSTIAVDHERISRQQRSESDQTRVDRGRDVFLTGTCAMCHTIRGTRALSRVGPDLTHIASRSMLAAGTIPNTRGHLAGWILNPQNLKQGTQMPPTQLPAADLHALLAYLESLE
jgi:cytochrome c oxidase subunit 2